MDATHALAVILCELNPPPERLADQLAWKPNPHGIAQALQVAHGAALGRIAARLEALDDPVRVERAEPASRSPLE